MKVAFVIFMSLLCHLVSATNYYVDSAAGSDSNTGTATDKPWKTIGKINSTSFAAGDSILFKKGSTWREALIVPSSGNTSKNLSFAYYGSGVNPRLLGSKVSTWSLSSGNVWVSDLTFTNPYGGGFTSEIFFEEISGTVKNGSYKSSTSALNAEYSWTWVSNKIYVYSATDPDQRYKSVEIPQIGTIIEPNNKQYLHFRGINLFYSASEGFGDGSYPNQKLTGLIVENAEIAFHGSIIAEIGYGITAVYSDMIIRNNKIHDCGRRSISLNPYASGFTVRNVLIKGNSLYNGNHTTGIDMSIGSGSFNVSLDSILICNNIIYDDPNTTMTSELLFAQNYKAGGTFTNLYIYDNIFKHPTISAVHLEGVNSAYIYNNTFYGHNKLKSGNTYHVFVDAGSTNVKIKNNIFFTDLSYDTGASGLAIYESTSQDHNQIDADYNLFYRVTASLRIIVANGANYTMSNLATIRSGLGWETHSPTPQNPLFVSTNDFHLQSASPVKSAGTIISGITCDFDGTTFGNPPSIGCFAGSGGVVAGPVYQSGCVEDNTPGVVNMSFDLTLAPVVPASTAFTVKVNSVTRTCFSVNLNGGVVNLVLSSPIQFGEVVTVSYTKPALNPLQAATGAQVENLLVKPVANNVDAVTAVDVNPGGAKIKIYPNPASRYINISYDEPYQSSQVIRIVNAAGATVSEGIIEAGTSSVQYPLNLTSGFYIIQLISGGNVTETKKLIVRN
jgi:hypothetical protein